MFSFSSVFYWPRLNSRVDEDFGAVEWPGSDYGLVILLLGGFMPFNLFSLHFLKYTMKIII